MCLQMAFFGRVSLRLNFSNPVVPSTFAVRLWAGAWIPSESPPLHPTRTCWLEESPCGSDPCHGRESGVPRSRLTPMVWGSPMCPFP